MEVYESSQCNKDHCYYYGKKQVDGATLRREDVKIMESRTNGTKQWLNKWGNIVGQSQVSTCSLYSHTLGDLNQQVYCILFIANFAGIDKVEAQAIFISAVD